jgi:hypothetical protein
MTRREKHHRLREKLIELWQSVCAQAGRREFQYGELIAAIQTHRGVKRGAAEEWFSKLKFNHIIAQKTTRRWTSNHRLFNALR